MTADKRNRPRESSAGSATVRAATVVILVALVGVATALAAYDRASATRLATATPRLGPTVTATSTPTMEPGSCLAVVGKEAPEKAYLGDMMPITLTFQAACSGVPFGLNVVLVEDASATMAGQKLRDMKEASWDLVESLNLEENSGTKVGVVAFQERSTELCRLTNDEKRVSSGIGRVRAQGGKAIESGIIGGLRMLTRERRASRWTDSETMIVFSDGLSDDGCREAIKAAWDAKGKGVGVVSVCVGRHCDEQCMRELASSPRYYCSIDEFNRVVEMLRRIRGEIKDVVLKSLAVTERLPQNMRYVTGSAEPDPWQLSPDEQTLQWITRYVPKDGVTFTLRVEPQELGRQVANHEAVAEFTNNLNWSGTAVFPVPQVEIEKRPSATPTCTATQTATADPTVAPPPSPTGSPPSNQVFLPRLARSMAQ